MTLYVSRHFFMLCISARSHRAAERTNNLLIALSLKCYDFEKQRGFGRIVKAVSNSMKVSENDSLVVQYIQEHTPENAIVFLTGVGKCYPLLRSHNVLNNLHQSYLRAPVVMFFPGTYNEQELILFNEIKDDNYYRAFRLVK